MEENIFHAIVAIIALLFAIFHKKLGEKAIDVRKKIFGKLLPSSSFGPTMVTFTQIGFLLIGTIIFIMSTLKILFKYI